MLRGTTYIFYGFLLFLGFLSGSSVRLSMDVDASVEAGEEFEVVVHVEKGKLESFARYQVDLPRGVVATGGKAMNANYTYDGESVRFVWLRLPYASSFEVKYNLRVDARLRGRFTLGGEFSYIESNVRKVEKIEGVEVEIRPSKKVAPDKQLDIQEYQRSIPAQRDLSLARSKVRCVREVPRIMGEGNDLIVRLLVSREALMKFAKIEEKLPEGYTAEPIETRDAIFSCEDGVVKFLWMTLPAEPQFVVSYRLIPPLGISEMEPTLEGRFSFMQNEFTRMIKITQRDVELHNMSAADMETLVRSVPLEVEGGSPMAPKGGTTVSGGQLQPEGPSEGGMDIPIRYQKIESGSGGGRRTGGRQRPIRMDAYLLEPEQGVYYRVQVAAGHRPIDINRYFRRLSLHADVRTERHEGWYKYSVGSFREYKEARDYRVEVWNTTPIHDAFVAAYNNGERITVQEALMITSQKWYR